jgi:hypothetical protein
MSGFCNYPESDLALIVEAYAGVRVVAMTRAAHLMA